MTKSVLLRLRNLLLFGSVMALAWQGVDSIKVKPRGRQLSASQSLKKVRVPVDGQHWMRRRKWKKKCMGKQCDGEGYCKLLFARRMRIVRHCPFVGNLHLVCGILYLIQNIMVIKYLSLQYRQKEGRPSAKETMEAVDPWQWR